TLRRYIIAQEKRMMRALALVLWPARRRPQQPRYHFREPECFRREVRAPHGMTPECTLIDPPTDELGEQPRPRQREAGSDRHRANAGARRAGGGISSDVAIFLNRHCTRFRNRLRFHRACRGPTLSSSSPRIAV